MPTPGRHRQLELPLFAAADQGEELLMVWPPPQPPVGEPLPTVDAIAAALAALEQEGTLL